MTASRLPSPARLLPLAALGLAAALAACGNPYALPPATQNTDQRVVYMYALTGTPVNTASAFNTITGLEVRTDASTDFDIAFDIVPDTSFGIGGTTGDSVFAVFPAGALGFAQDPGVQKTTVNYDSLKLAPSSGYIVDKALRLDSGTVVIVASRSQTCNYGLSSHLYAKFRVDAIDWTARKLSLTMLTDPNCGYRGLGPGIPQQ